MKQISEKKNMFVGVILSYVTIAVGIVLAIFYTPFVLGKLGSTQYGIRTFAYSIVSYLSFLSVGMGGCYLRFRMLAIKEKGVEGDKHFNGLFFVVFLIIGAAALVIGLLMTLLFYTGAIPLNDSYTETDKFVFEIIMLINVINTAIYFPLSVYRLFINSEKKFIWSNSINLVDTLLSPIVTVIMFTYLPGQFLAIDATAITVICNIVIWSANVIFALVPLKMKMTLKLNREDAHMFKQMIVFSIFVFLLNTAISLNPLTDKVVLGFVTDSNDVTKYQLSITFLSYITTMVSSVAAVFLPRITKDVIDNDMKSVERLYNMVSKTIVIISIFIVGGYVACGEAFIRAWILDPANNIDAEYCLNIYYYSVVLMIAQTSLMSAQFSIYIHQALNKHKIPALIYVGVLLINFAISITLCILLKPYGLSIWGCILGTIFSYITEAVALTIYNEKYIHFHIYKSWIYWAIEIGIALIPIGVTFLLYHFVNVSELTSNEGLNPWIETLIRGGTYVVIYLPLEFLINHKFIKNLFASLKENKKAKQAISE